MKTDPIIELRDITLMRGGVKLYDRFSFTVRAGEHWVIQGENGAGKTLLLQLIAGAVHPARGEIEYSFIGAGDWDTRFRQRAENVHFVPTEGLQDFLSGMDGTFYQQRYYSIEETSLPTVRDLLGKGAGHSPEVAESFDLHALLDLPVTRLSNGQLKKLMIIRQLSRHIPRILLLDYPLDGLDTDSRRDLILFLDKLANRFGIQILMVDHGSELPAVINRKLVLQEFQIARIEEIQTERPVRRSPPPARMAGGVTNSREAIVEMQNVTIRYGSRKILDNINWKIRRGERWALTGRNGSGKTTLFSMIYADHPMAYSQKVFLFGRRRGSGESIWDIKRRINYFGPEQLHFLNTKIIRTTAWDYIRSQPHQDEKILDELIGFFNARAYIHQPVWTLSSGQLQMVMLINLLADRRELLLLDEPFQFLDPDNHAMLARYLQQRLDSDVTLVLITHDERDVIQWTESRMDLTPPENRNALS